MGVILLKHVLRPQMQRNHIFWPHAAGSKAVVARSLLHRRKRPFLGARLRQGVSVRQRPFVNCAAKANKDTNAADSVTPA
jgi:hypothetical protein